MNTDSQLNYDISVVVTAHAEGRLAHRTMRSIQAAIKDAQSQGLRCEIIIVLDCPTSETLAYFVRWRGKACILEVANRDPGLNRNAAAELAQGKYVAIIDADDLFGRGWLVLAHQRAEQAMLEDFIVHAEFTIYFENRHSITHHHPSLSGNFSKLELLGVNHWTSVLFAPRATFLKCPFFPSELNSGFGYEDWHWITTVLAVGGEVLIAPGACKFTRYKMSGSRLSFHDSGHALLQPTRLFDPRYNPVLAMHQPEAQTNLRNQSKTSTWRERVSSLKEKLNLLPKYLSRATEWCPPVQKALGKDYRSYVGYGIRRSMLPQEVNEQWLALAEIEPQLYPSDHYLGRIDWFEHPPEQSAEVYAQICRMIVDCHRDVVGPQFTHVFLVPWMKTSEADLVAMKYILLTASNPANRVLVIATEDTDSPWKNRLPASVQFINIGVAIQVLPILKQRQLLAQFLIQLQPQVIHLINSKLGNQVFEQYGRAISLISRSYTTTSCIDIDPDGAVAGYSITSLPKYTEYLTAITSDNQCICDYLAELFAIDPAKMFVHYQPVVIKELPQRNRSKSDSRLNVLWAGRLDRQKRPDLMLEIAKGCEAEDMHFHVYGSSVIADDRANVDFHHSPNVTYHGPLESLHSIEPAKFDVFLNTSQWDGMPIILLEAVAEGLPIVTSDVGGIRELIVQDETGLIINPFDDIEQYVVALRRVRQDPKLRERLLLASRQVVGVRHSWEHFAADVNALPGYLEAPCQLERAELSRLE